MGEREEQIQEATAEQSPVVKVERGMVLLYENAPPKNVERPIRYELLTVASVTRNAKNWRAKLIGHSPGMVIEYSARFEDGVVREPFREFGLSQRDLRLVWSHTADPSGSAPPSNPHAPDGGGV